MAQLTVQNKSAFPVNVELIYDGIAHHYRWDVKPAEKTEIPVAPVIWKVSAFWACDATRIDHSKTADPDATVILDGSPYYISGQIPENLVHQIAPPGEVFPQNPPALAMAEGVRLARLQILRQPSGGIGGVHLTGDFAEIAMPQLATIAAKTPDKLGRVTLAVSKEVYQGTSLHAARGNRECEVTIEGGAVAYRWWPELLLFTVQATHPFTMTCHDLMTGERRHAQ